jgi:hypothetical protein
LSKTITLRLSEQTYQKFMLAARSDNRPISNLIETLALRKLEELYVIDEFEMSEIQSNEPLKAKLKTSTTQAREKRGGFVEWS